MELHFLALEMFLSYSLQFFLPPDLKKNKSSVLLAIFIFTQNKVFIWENTEKAFYFRIAWLPSPILSSNNIHSVCFFNNAKLNSASYLLFFKCNFFCLLIQMIAKTEHNCFHTTSCTISELLQMPWSMT